MMQVYRTLLSLGLFIAACAVLCFAQAPTDSTNAAATVVAITGNVSVLRDSQPWALSIGSAVRPQQVIVTGPDGYATFRVSDGSTFEVFPNSRITFRNTPGDWKDLLEMWLGQVKVHIQKLSGLPNRNRVRTPTAIISVRGTVFDVKVEEEDTTEVYVEEGQVDVRHNILGGETRILNPGEYIRVYRNVPLAQKMIDRGSIIKAAMRAAAEAVYTTMTRTPRGAGPASGGGGTGGGGLPGDHGSGGKNPPSPPSSGGGSTTTPPPDAGGGAPPPPPGG